jgi:predicted PurR-regulated permease PerM
MDQDVNMQTETSLTQKAIDIAIRLGVLAVLVAWCFQILRPFISPVIWGSIIAVTLLPVFEKISTKLGDRRKLTAIIITLGSLMLIILPSIQLTVSSVDSLHTLSEKLQDEAFKLPSPPEGIRDWPVIGESAENLWQGATVNLEATLVKFQPQIVGFAKWLLKTFVGIAAGLVMFALAIIIAGILMASAKSGGMMAKHLFVRVAGSHGEEIVGITVQTIRSVVKGIIGVSMIQALLAGLGFAVAGIPAAGLWAFLCLVLAIIQIGVAPVVLLVDHLCVLYDGQGVGCPPHRVARAGGRFGWPHESRHFRTRRRGAHAGDLFRRHRRVYCHRFFRAFYRGCGFIRRVQAA